VEHSGFRLLVDPGFAVVPVLLQSMAADDVDAAFVSHRHPDHCADLNPLLRARALGGGATDPIPVYASPGALDAVLALDAMRVLTEASVLHPIDERARFEIGPFAARARLLPHSVPNLGVRLEADGQALAYTGDAGPSPAMTNLAGGADLLLAEATYVDEVPTDMVGKLSSAADAGALAHDAGVGTLVLTHLWPGADPAAAVRAAAAQFDGVIHVAVPPLTVALRAPFRPLLDPPPGYPCGVSRAGGRPSSCTARQPRSTTAHDEER
jgi:ribonuclease BN (tRNA processing enzyme)